MRVKTGIVRRRRHKKVLKQAKGFYSGRRKHFRKAKEQLERSLCYAFRDRKQKKRDFRSLWIIRINAACRMQDISYSKFMHGLKLANIEMDRKILADMALNDIESFNKLVQTAKGAMKQCDNTQSYIVLLCIVHNGDETDEIMVSLITTAINSIDYSMQKGKSEAD